MPSTRYSPGSAGFRQKRRASGGSVTNDIVSERLTPGGKTQPPPSKQSENAVVKADHALPVMFEENTNRRLASVDSTFVKVSVTLMGSRNRYMERVQTSRTRLATPFTGLALHVS